MFWGIGFGAERLGLAALRFPRSAGVLLLALLVLIGISLPKVTFDDDIHRVFLSDSPLSDAQRAYEAAQSPPLSTVVLYITAPESFSPAQMSGLRDMALDLEFVDGLSGVASPFSLRMPPTPDAPSGSPVFAPEIGADYATRIDSFRDLGTGLPTFLNSDANAMLMSLPVDLDQTDLPDALRDIRAELDRGLPDGVTATVTGEDAISAEIVGGLRADLLSLNLWGAALIALAALALLRDLRMAVLVVVPAICGAAGVLALSVWLGYPVTVLSNVIPILLLVLGVADAVHLARHLKASPGDISGTLRDVGPACALTALTTAAAFAGILLTRNAQLLEFAILGVLGTLLAFALTITSFTLLARVMPLSTRALPTFGTGIARRLTRHGVARSKSTIALSALLLVICIAGFMQTTAWFPLYRNLPDDSPTIAANDAIARDFGGAFQMIVESEGDWATTRRIHDRLSELSGPETVLSEVSFARWLGTPDQRPTQEQLADLPQALVSQLRPGSGVSRLLVLTPEPMRDAATLEQFDRLSAAATEARADRILGLPAIMRHEAVDLIAQLSRGLVVAALGATLLVALAFRSVRLIPILLIPNILPLMVTGASLQLWAGGLLTPTAVLALTIAFGIAIDDTVHFLSRYRMAQARGDSPEKAVRAATASAGQVMVLTTLLLTVGLCITAFSGFPPIRLFGGMMITTLWAALLVDLTLVPALLTWKETAHVPD